MFRSPPGSNRPYEPNRDPRPAATSSSGGFSSFFSSFFGSSFGAPPRDGPPPSFARVASSTASGARAAMASAWACAFARRSFTLSRVGNPDSTASAIAWRYAFERSGRIGRGVRGGEVRADLHVIDREHIPAEDGPGLVRPAEIEADDEREDFEPREDLRDVPRYSVPRVHEELVLLAHA